MKGNWVPEDDVRLVRHALFYSIVPFARRHKHIAARSGFLLLFDCETPDRPPPASHTWPWRPLGGQQPTGPLCPRRLVEELGEGNWSVIARHFPGRIGKQCRERWNNQLHPDIKRDAWSEAEERQLIQVQLEIQ